jgi:hypothetical protein
MCKTGGEFVDHLLLHSTFASELWAMVFDLFGVSWVMPRTAVEALACWQGSFGRHPNFPIWQVVPHYLMWCIWRERNGCIFEDCERSYVEIKLIFLRSLLDWVVGWGLYSCNSLIQFLELCFLRAP